MSSSSSSSSSATLLRSTRSYNDFLDLMNIMIGRRADGLESDVSEPNSAPAVAVGKAKSWWIHPLILLSWSALYEFMSFVSMTVVADFYLTVTSNDSNKFLYTLRKACVVIAIISVCKSFQTFYVDKCALQWRENIVDYLHRRYFTCLDQISSADGGSMSEMIACNPEQRISQDVDKLTIETSKNFDKLLITPVLILFYSYYLWSLFGWLAPFCCYVYFVLGAIVSAHLARQMVDPIICQETLEGEFRLTHSNLCKNLHEVNLLRGTAREKSKAVETFSNLLSNCLQLITLRLYTNLFVNMHSYSGSIDVLCRNKFDNLTPYNFNFLVSYIVVGFSVLYFLEAREDLDSPEIASIMAQGSYACLYLINSFSSLLQSAESLSEIFGLTERVLQLLRLISPVKGCNQTRSIYNHNSTFSYVSRNLFKSIFGTWGVSDVPSNDSVLNEYVNLGAGEAECDDLEAVGKVNMSSISPVHPLQPVPFYGSSSSHKNDILVFIDNLCLTTPLDVRLIEALTLQVSLGDRVHISGPVGCGKSTLVKYIAASHNLENTIETIHFHKCMFPSRLSSTSREFQVLSDPEIEITDEKLDIIFRGLGVFQNVVFIPDIHYFFVGSLMENVLYPLNMSDLLQKSNRNDLSMIEAKVHAFLEKSMEKILIELGLNHLLFYESKSSEKLGKSVVDWSSVLSNGERSLLSVARALLKKPLLLICDNFELVAAENVLKLFKEHCSACIVASNRETCDILSDWCNKEIVL